MHRLSLLLFSTLALAGPAHATGNAADVEIVDAASGRVLPVYHHLGHDYIAGEPGHEYGIRLANRNPQRILAVASVDGVNVVSGETAAPDQTGYVLQPLQHYDIRGWRKSLDRVASFYFTSVPDSYAARTGRARDVGVIGVAVFREKSWEYPSKVAINTSGIDDRAAESERAAAVPPPAMPAPPPSSPIVTGAAPTALGAAAPMMPADKPADAAARLGTGHGRSMDSEVTNTDFERASAMPAEVVAIYYDSRQNLIAQGIIPRPFVPPPHQPNPFPNSFVPDP